MFSRERRFKARTTCKLQVWKDALTHKQQSPYMRHTLAGGTMRDLSFCPYEVRLFLLS